MARFAEQEGIGLTTIVLDPKDTFRFALDRWTVEALAAELRRATESSSPGLGYWE